MATQKNTSPPGAAPTQTRGSSRDAAKEASWSRKDTLLAAAAAFAVILTVLFMNGRSLGIQVVQDQDAEDYQGEEDFTANDLNGAWDRTGASVISLEGSTAEIAGSGAYVLDGSVYIRNAGTYVLSGTLTNGSVVVDAYRSSKVFLLLDGVDIYCEEDAALRVNQADKVFLTLAEGTENRLRSGETFSEEALADKAGGTVFAHDDLTINGSGALSIEGNYKHGIDANDSLTITGGEISITSVEDGVHVNEAFKFTGADLEIAAGDDAIHADESILVDGGTILITECYEGLEALTIDMRDGIVTVNASDDGFNANGNSDMGFGGFGGGGFGGGGGMGGGHRRWGSDGTAESGGMSNGGMPGDTASSSDAAPGGRTQDGDPGDSSSDRMQDDRIQVAGNGNGNGSDAGISGVIRTDSAETLAANTSDTTDTIENANRADGAPSNADRTNGSGNANEATNATDPARNANGANIADNGDDSEESEASETWIHISGGTVNILNGSGRDADGLDSNGDILITGGTVRVSLVDTGGNCAIDYGSESGGKCEITGGSLIACGSAAMAEPFDDSSTQCSIFYAMSESAEAGTVLRLEDNDGNVLLEYEVPNSFSAVHLSCPEMVLGGTYRITAGDQSEEVTLDSVSVTAGESSGGRGFGGGGFGGRGGGRGGWGRDGNGNGNGTSSDGIRTGDAQGWGAGDAAFPGPPDWAEWGTGSDGGFPFPPGGGDGNGGPPDGMGPGGMGPGGMGPDGMGPPGGPGGWGNASDGTGGRMGMGMMGMGGPPGMWQESAQEDASADSHFKSLADMDEDTRLFLIASVLVLLAGLGFAYVFKRRRP